MKRSIVIVFSAKELNYIDMALRRDIAHMETWPKLGNMPHLLWFTKRLQGRLRRLHTKATREAMGEKRWSEMRKRVNRFIRQAKLSN